MFSFLHAADIHLDSPLRGLELPPEAPLDQIRGAARRAFENLVTLALDEEVSFVLLAGDLYDGDWRDFNTGLFFNRQMARLKEVGIPAIAISGNHDAASQITRNLRPPDNVKFLSTKKPETHHLKDLNVAIHGQGFASRAVTDDLSAAYPQAIPGCFNIGLLHTALSGREGHEPYAPGTVDGLRSKGYQYWALGHVHQREVVLNDPWILFPGTIQGRHIKEQGAKGCTLVKVHDGHVTSVEHRELDILRWVLCTVDLTGCATAEELYAPLQAALQAALESGDGRPVIARIVLVGKTTVHQRLQRESDKWVNEIIGMAASLGGAGLWVEKVKIRTTESLDLDLLLADDSPIGGLLRMVATLQAGSERLADIDPEIGGFLAKLPAEIRGGDDPFLPDGEQQWAEICTDVRELLTARLLHAGGAR